MYLGPRISIPGASPLPLEQELKRCDDLLAQWFPAWHRAHTQTWVGAWNVHSSLLFHFTEGAVAGPKTSYSAVSAITVTLATVTFSGHWVCVQRISLLSTTRHPHCLIYQLLECACLLDVGPCWVLKHKILKGLGKKELSCNILDFPI